MRDQLVTDGSRQHGRLPQRPAVVNPLDEFGGLQRVVRRTRLKEWIGFALVHPEVWASMIVQDAKYLGTSEIFAYAASGGPIHHHQAVTRGGVARLPDELFGATAGIERRGYKIEYRFGDDGGRHHLSVDIDATTRAPAIRAELELDGASATPPLSVSAPLRGGSTYTYKAAFPTSGWLRVGDREHHFEPDRDVAILDEHRSLLPYRTDWTWGTFATQQDGGMVGANFASRPMVAGTEDESCLWTPSAVEPLAEVAFVQDGDDPLDPWRVRSRDGRLDLRFEPVHRQVVQHQLGVFAIDYFMLYGRYSGTVRGRDGHHSIDGAHGVCERMHARL